MLIYDKLIDACLKKYNWTFESVILEDISNMSTEELRLHEVKLNQAYAERLEIFLEDNAYDRSVLLTYSASNYIDDRDFVDKLIGKIFAPLDNMLRNFVLLLKDHSNALTDRLAVKLKLINDAINKLRNIDVRANGDIVVKTFSKESLKRYIDSEVSDREHYNENEFNYITSFNYVKFEEYYYKYKNDMDFYGFFKLILLLSTDIDEDHEITSQNLRSNAYERFVKDYVDRVVDRYEQMSKLKKVYEENPIKEVLPLVTDLLYNFSEKYKNFMYRHTRIFEGMYSKIEYLLKDFINHLYRSRKLYTEDIGSIDVSYIIKFFKTFKYQIDKAHNRYIILELSFADKILEDAYTIIRHSR